MSMLINAHWRVLPPSQGIDKNWHVTDDGDTRVAHCFGFSHDIDSGEAIARRICAALNYCRGIPLGQLEGNDSLSDPPMATAGPAQGHSPECVWAQLDERTWGTSCMRLIQFASPHVVEFQFCDQCGGRIRLDCDEPVSDLRRDVSNRIPRLFAAGSYTVDGELRQFQVCTADERTQRVRACSNPEQLREALASTGLQSTVRAAIERRLRQLERAP